MASQYLFLGFPLRADAPGPPAIPPIELYPFMTIANDGANVTLMRLTTHTGTHLDTPLHVIPEGSSLTDFRPEDFVFTRPVVIDLRLKDEEVVEPEHLAPWVDRGEDADILLFRFGYGPVRRVEKERYSTRAPGFGVAGATFLRENFPSLRAIGMDVPSLSCIASLDETFEAHHVLLGGAGRRFLVLEDLNLEYDLSRLSTVIVAPLLVEGRDGAPCTVFGIVE